jgi:hypothetical protein
MLSPREEKFLKETRLRNLKRKYSKIVQHADLMEYASEIKSEIDALESELKL